MCGLPRPSTAKLKNPPTFDLESRVRITQVPLIFVGVIVGVIVGVGIGTSGSFVGVESGVALAHPEITNKTIINKPIINNDFW